MKEIKIANKPLLVVVGMFLVVCVITIGIVKKAYAMEWRESGTLKFGCDVGRGCSTPEGSEGTCGWDGNEHVYKCGCYVETPGGQEYHGSIEPYCGAVTSH